MLGDDVGAALDQRHGGLLLGRRIVPGERPDDLDGRRRVDRTGAEGEGVEAGDHGGDRLGGDEADLVGLGHRAGDHPGEIAAVPELAVEIEDVVGRRDGRGDAEEELVGILLGDLLGERLIAERGREDHVVALRDEVLLDIGDIGRLGDRLDEGRRDALCLEAFAAGVVAEGPAGIADRSDIDEGGLELVCRLAGTRSGQRSRADGEAGE